MVMVTKARVTPLPDPLFELTPLGKRSAEKSQTSSKLVDQFHTVHDEHEQEHDDQTDNDDRPIIFATRSSNEFFGLDVEEYRTLQMRLPSIPLFDQNEQTTDEIDDEYYSESSTEAVSRSSEYSDNSPRLNRKIYFADECPGQALSQLCEYEPEYSAVDFDKQEAERHRNMQFCACTIM